MGEELPNQSKNRAFLSQFLNEGIYLIPEEKTSVIGEAQEQPPEEAPEVAEIQNDQIAEASPTSEEEEVGVEKTAAQQPEEPSQETPSNKASNEEQTDESIPSNDNDSSQPESEALSVKNHEDQEEATASSEAQNTPEAEETPSSGEATLEEPGQQPETPPQATSTETPQPESPVASAKDGSLIPPYEGQNQKGILILVNHQSDKNLLPKEQLILGRILKAVNLSMDDVAVVNLEKTGTSIEQITEGLTTEQILAFGVDATDLPILVQPMKLEEWNGKTLLATPSLEEIAMNKQNKKQLWHNLKTMFDI